jgi:siroheme synthase-like protein
VSGIPILVEARDLRVLVVGGGAVAARKSGALCAAGAKVRIVAPDIGPAIRALVDERRMDLVERRYRSGDVGDAELVIAATNSRETNAAVAVDARAANRLVNVADAADEGSFSTMATHRAGGLTVGVSAGVPAAAARIRDALSERFDDRYAAALAELSLLRDAMLSAGQGERWRALSADVLGTGFCEAVEAETLDQRLAAWR